MERKFKGPPSSQESVQGETHWSGAMSFAEGGGVMAKWMEIGWVAGARAGPASPGKQEFSLGHRLREPTLVAGPQRMSAYYYRCCGDPWLERPPCAGTQFGCGSSRTHCMGQYGQPCRDPGVCVWQGLRKGIRKQQPRLRSTLPTPSAYASIAWIELSKHFIKAVWHWSKNGKVTEI